MRLIEKIEIQHFRSFDGGDRYEKRTPVVVPHLKDVNIFSGANDSGKSNLLRALNLFFNGEVIPGQAFDIHKDLSNNHRARSDQRISEKRKAGAKDVRQRDLWVKIKIYFSIPKNRGVLPAHFYVEKTWDKNGESKEKNSNIFLMKEKEKKGKLNEKEKTSLQMSLTKFLNNIKFEYVPAIKDRSYFRSLFAKLQDYLFEDRKKETNDFTKTSQEFNRILQKILQNYSKILRIVPE